MPRIAQVLMRRPSVRARPTSPGREAWLRTRIASSADDATCACTPHNRRTTPSAATTAFGSDTIARTMGVTTFSLFRIASSLETADEKRSLFSGYILNNPALLKATGLSIVTILLATELGVLKNVLDMTSLTGQQWAVCIGVALSLIVVEEVKKALKIQTDEEPVVSAVPVAA